MSWTSDNTQGLAGYTPGNKQVVGGQQNVFDVQMAGEAKWVYIRLQLDSHSADGNFDITDPPFVPMPTYGCINATVLKLGAGRPEGK